MTELKDCNTKGKGPNGMGGAGFAARFMFLIILWIFGLWVNRFISSNLLSWIFVTSLLGYVILSAIFLSVRRCKTLGMRKERVFLLFIPFYNVYFLYLLISGE